MFDLAEKADMAKALKGRDHLSKAQRSYCMSRVKGKDTSLETIVRSSLHRQGLRFRKNVRSLPGSPDVVFPRKKIAVFLDGDFWHGFQFSHWSKPLNPYWRAKISRNIARDRKNRRKLRLNGWTVLRFWEHEVSDDLDAVIQAILRTLDEQDGCNKSPL
jgi:DNA mismatch endonuclease (patch repair protein)